MCLYIIDMAYDELFTIQRRWPTKGAAELKDVYLMPRIVLY